MLTQSAICPQLANHLAKVRATIEALNLPALPAMPYSPYVVNGATWFDALDRMQSDKRND